MAYIEFVSRRQFELREFIRCSTPVAFTIQEISYPLCQKKCMAGTLIDTLARPWIQRHGGVSHQRPALTIWDPQIAWDAARAANGAFPICICKARGKRRHRSQLGHQAAFWVSLKFVKAVQGNGYRKHGETVVDRHAVRQIVSLIVKFGRGPFVGLDPAEVGVIHGTTNRFFLLNFRSDFLRDERPHPIRANNDPGPGLLPFTGSLPFHPRNTTAL